MSPFCMPTISLREEGEQDGGQRELTARAVAARRNSRVVEVEVGSTDGGSGDLEDDVVVLGDLWVAK